MTFTKSKDKLVTVRYMHRSLGEQPSPDVSGAPDTTGPAVDNSNRGSSGPKRSKLDRESDPDQAKKKSTPAVVPPAAPVVTAPVVSAPAMDGQAIIDALSLVAEFQKNSRVIGTSPSIYIGGVSAMIEAVNWAKDLDTLQKAQEAISKFELGMRPGEVSHVLVSATPEGKVSVLKLPALDAPVISDGKSSSYRTTISAPNFDRFRDIFKTDKQKQKELHDWYESLDKETKDILERERKKANTVPGLTIKPPA